MLGITCDASNVVAEHQKMAADLVGEMHRAAEESADILVGAIRHNLWRKILRPNASTGALYKAIDSKVYERNGDLIIGVGDKEKMSKDAPYWRIQDEGGPIASKLVPGFFVDIAGRPVPFDPARGPGGGNDLTTVRRGLDVFVYETKTHTYMYVHKPIRPKHYFDAGALSVNEMVLITFEKALRRVFR